MTYQPWTSFASLQLHAQKWDTNTVPTDYLQVCLVDPYQCCVVIWIFKEPLISFISNIKRTLCSGSLEKKQNQRAIGCGWLFVFFQKNCEPWLCKNWVFDVLRTMIMIVIIIKGLFLFLITTQHQSLPGVGLNFFDPSNRWGSGWGIENRLA